MLFPTRMVDSRRSYWADRDITSCARLSPSSAIFFRRIRLKDENAVSVAEKYADIVTSTSINRSSCILLPSGSFISN